MAEVCLGVVVLNLEPLGGVRFDHRQVILLADLNLDSYGFFGELVIVLREVDAYDLVDHGLVFFVHFQKVLNILIVR